MTEAEGYSKPSESVRQTKRRRIQNHGFIHSYLHKSPKFHNSIILCVYFSMQLNSALAVNAKSTAGWPAI
jgi:hypothetical protein